MRARRLRSLLLLPVLLGCGVAAGSAGAATLTIAWNITRTVFIQHTGTMTATFQASNPATLLAGPAIVSFWSLSGTAPFVFGSRVVDFQLAAPLSGTFNGAAFQQTGAASIGGTWTYCGRVLCISRSQTTYPVVSLVANIGASTIAGTLVFSATYIPMGGTLTPPWSFTGQETSRLFVPEPGAGGLLGGALLAGLTAACTSRRRR